MPLPSRPGLLALPLAAAALLGGSPPVAAEAMAPAPGPRHHVAVALGEDAPYGKPGAAAFFEITAHPAADGRPGRLCYRVETDLPDVDGVRVFGMTIFPLDPAAVNRPTPTCSDATDAAQSAVVETLVTAADPSLHVVVDTASWPDWAAAGTTEVDVLREGYVPALYADLLGRAPDVGGLDHWGGLLWRGAPPEVVVHGVMTSSAEFYDGYVRAAYAGLLHREPDAAGLRWWSDGFRAGRFSLATVITELASSAEYAAVRGGSTRDGLVTALYGDLLGRVPADTERAYWAGQLAGRPAGQVVGGFVGSDEHLGGLVADAYLTYLGRSTDAGGLRFWTERLRAGHRYEDFVRGLLSSPEYLASTGVLL